MTTWDIGDIGTYRFLCAVADLHGWRVALHDLSDAADDVDLPSIGVWDRPLNDPDAKLLEAMVVADGDLDFTAECILTGLIRQGYEVPL